MGVHLSCTHRALYQYSGGGLDALCFSAEEAVNAYRGAGALHGRTQLQSVCSSQVAGIYANLSE